MAVRGYAVGLCLGLACGCGASSQAAPAVSSQPAAAPAISLKDAMRHHFADATAARDAVIAGRLEDTRPPLRALAAAAPERVLPDDWVPWMMDMAAVAREGAQARTLDEAAAAVAMLGASCGDCHRTTHGGPRDPASTKADYQPEGRTGLAEKMARHRFAADALWLGLTGPQHQAWARGAAALMNINVPSLVTAQGRPVVQDRAASGEGTLQGEADPRLPEQEQAQQQQQAEQDQPPQGQAEPSAQADQPKAPSAAGTIDLDAALRALRELGKQADQAKIASEKQAVFGKVIARCGDCHAALGIHVKLIPVSPD